MSSIGKNIRKIRTVKKLSQSAFADIFGLTRASIGAYEEGRAEPKIDTIVNIAKHFSISVDSIISKELTINEIYHFDIFKDELLNGKRKNIANDKQIAFVAATQSREYLKRHEDPSFIQALETLKLPFDSVKGLRAFEHSGNDMLYGHNGIRHGDILVAKKIDNPDNLSLFTGLVYIICTKKDLVVRVLRENSKLLTFSTLYPSLPMLKLAFDEILEIWEVKGAYTQNLYMPEQHESRLFEIEKTIERLKEKID